MSDSGSDSARRGLASFRSRDFTLLIVGKTVGSIVVAAVCWRAFPQLARVNRFDEVR